MMFEDDSPGYFYYFRYFILKPDLTVGMFFILRGGKTWTITCLYSFKDIILYACIWIVVILKFYMDENINYITNSLFDIPFKW